MLMFNARMSAEKVARRRWFRWFYEPLLSSYTEIFAQNAGYKFNLEALSIPLPISKLVGNVKALAPPLPVSESELQQVKESIGQRSIWVLASSHEGEEDIALRAHGLILEKKAQVLLVIVPRHVTNAGSLVQLAAGMGLKAALRSETPKIPPDASVYIANTVGEMGLWFRISQVALIGGSLVPHGGHNPYEATAIGCPVLFGPHIENCKESYDDLVERGLASLVHSPEDLVTKVLAHMGQSIATKRRSPETVEQPLAAPLYERISSYVSQAVYDSTSVPVR
jgi:3-deoxy-D-manno-octulosonic-acid transferase